MIATMKVGASVGENRRVSELKMKTQKLEHFIVENLRYYRIICKSIFCYNTL